MKLNYDPETDSLYIDFSSKAGTEAREIADGVIADFDDDGNLVGLDIEDASKKLDLGSVDVDALPIPVLKSA